MEGLQIGLVLDFWLSFFTLGRFTGRWYLAAADGSPAGRSRVVDEAP